MCCAYNNTEERDSTRTVSEAYTQCEKLLSDLNSCPYPCEENSPCDGPLCLCENKHFTPAAALLGLTRTSADQPHLLQVGERLIDVGARRNPVCGHMLVYSCANKFAFHSRDFLFKLCAFQRDMFWGNSSSPLWKQHMFVTENVSTG